MGQKSENKVVFDLLEERHGPAFMQDIQDRLTLCEQREIQYLEMKQMQDVLIRFRRRVRSMVKHYRHWQADYQTEQDEIEKVYKAYDGIFIRRQIQDAWRLYVMVNRDYHEMRRTYLERLVTFPRTRRKAA